MGKPGAGKGTQAQRLIQDYPFTILATGDIIRQAVKDKTPLGLEMKQKMDTGQLIDDDIILNLIDAELEKHENVILDGFPRTLKQAQALTERKEIDMVLFLHVDDQVVINRITNRWMVNHDGKQLSFNSKKKAQKYAEEKGGEAFQRNDDTKEVITKRLAQYQNETKPLLSYYYEQDKLHTVEGFGDVEDVHEEICKRIEKIKSQTTNI